MKLINPNTQSTTYQKETTMKTIIQLCATICIALAIVKGAHASDAVGPGDRDTLWLVGGGAGVYTNVYKGENQSGSLIPNLRYNGKLFFIKNATLNLSLVTAGAFSGGLTLATDSSFLSDTDDYRDNAQLAGLNERDATIEGGLYINHTSKLGRASLSVMSDLGHEHDGQAATLSYTFDLRAGNWFINPMIGLHWMGNKKVNHYYGVSATEATAQRLAYEAGSALNAFLAIRGRYEFSQHWDFEVHAGATRLDSSISSSSIVDEDYVAFGGLSINYSF
ncbi:MAG: MipA/OmpV family protein [Pseudomonadales bacterium]